MESSPEGSITDVRAKPMEGNSKVTNYHEDTGVHDLPNLTTMRQRILGRRGLRLMGKLLRTISILLICPGLWLAAGPLLAVDLRPDIHLTVKVRGTDDGGELVVEIPEVLPEDWTDNLSGKLQDQLQGQEDLVQATERSGNRFIAVIARFETLADMNDAVTFLTLPDLFDHELPGLFSQFEFSQSGSVLSKTYTYHASVNQITSETLGQLLDISYHVELPGIITEDNAPYIEEGLPTWRLEVGQPLEMYAESHLIAGVQLTSEWLPLLIGLVILGGVGVGATWVYRQLRYRYRRRHRWEKLGEEYDFLVGEHSDFDEAMEDVSGVYLDDDDYSHYDDFGT